MLLIECPYCGKRPELEFSHGGQAHVARAKNPADVSAQEWTDFLYMRSNIKGVHAERWRHTHGCGRFFNALRDTTTDHFVATYKAGEPRPTIAGQAPGGVGSPGRVGSPGEAGSPREASSPGGAGSSGGAGVPSGAGSPRSPGLDPQVHS